MTGKGVKAHHRRKSSERIVTVEGIRKPIRDFNVNEMNKKFDVGVGAGGVLRTQYL